MVGGKEGYVIVSVDYSQIELRIAAGMAKDPELIRALEEEDVHRSVAAIMYKKDLADITKEQRRSAKAASFGLIYDGTARTLFRTAK
jgi:DNA polymerase-1